MADQSNVLLLSQAANLAEVTAAETPAQASCGEVRIPEEAVQAASRLRFCLQPSDRVIAFTGVDHDDGAAYLAAQMAAALGRLEQTPTLLIDGDVRCPSLHALLGVSNSPGLSDLLEGRCAIAEAIHPTDTANLQLLPAGVPCTQPVTLFCAPGCAATFARLRHDYPRIVLHPGPIARSAEAISLVPQCDGLVLVLAAGKCNHTQVEDVRRQLSVLNRRVLGVMLAQQVR